MTEVVDGDENMWEDFEKPGPDYLFLEFEEFDEEAEVASAACFDNGALAAQEPAATASDTPAKDVAPVRASDCPMRVIFASFSSVSIAANTANVRTTPRRYIPSLLSFE